MSAAAFAGGYPQLTLKGTFEIIGDIVEPAVPAEAWEANGGAP